MLLPEIGAYLAANSIGTVGTTIFYGQMPETPDDCVTLFEYAGEPPEDTHDAQHYEKPGLQVLVRDTSYSDARTKIASISALLHTLANTSLTGTKYLYIRAVQSPFVLERDSSNRVVMAQNFIVTKAR